MPISALFGLTRLPEYQGPTLTPAQQEVREIVAQSWETATSLSTALPLLVGGFASRLAQGAVLSGSARISTISRGILTPLVRPAAWGASLFAEVGAFELTNRFIIGLTGSIRPMNCWRWNGEGGWKTTALTNGITFGTLRGAGRAARGENIIFQHATQSSAMVAGHQVAGALELIPQPEGTLTQQFFHAEMTNIQIAGTMGALHAMAPGVHAWERSMDLNLRVGAKHSALPSEGRNALPLRTPWDLLPFQPAPVLAINGKQSPKPEPFSGTEALLSKTIDSTPYLQIKGFSGGQAVGGDRRNEIERRFLEPFLHRSLAAIYAKKIIENVLDTPFPDSGFHTRLLEAFVEAPDIGTREQVLTAAAIKHVFILNPLHTSSGTFENTLLQLLLTKALKIESHPERQAALHRLSHAMAMGLKKSDLTELTKENFESKTFALPESSRPSPRFTLLNFPAAARLLPGYGWKRSLLLLHFIEEEAQGSRTRAFTMIRFFREGRIKYGAALMDEVLGAAKEHPLGRLLLRRALLTLATEDIPEKLKELLPANDEETLEAVGRMKREGKSPEEIARAINGTRHTAYFENLSLARKLVDVIEDVRPFLENPSQTHENWKKYRGNILTVLPRAKDFGFEDLIALLELNGKENPFLLSLQNAIKANKLKVTFLSDLEFDDKVKNWGEVHECKYTLVVQSLQEGKPSEIFIRKMPLIDLSTPLGRDLAVAEVVNRVDGLRHEWEHWRHSAGNFEGKEPGSKPFHFGSIDRGERDISEILAILEEERDHIKNVENYFMRVAARTGDNLPLFLRGFSERSYYLKVNEEIARKLLGPQESP